MSDDFDFSDEGLAALADAEETEAVEPEAESTDTPEAEAQVEAETPAEEPVADASSQDDDYRTRYENLVSKLGEQGQELGQLRKQIEAAQQAQQPQQTSAFEEYRPSSAQELLDLAGEPDNAEWAFHFAATQAPEYLPHVLAEVQMYDPAAAERMRMEYYTYVAQQSAPQQQQDPYLAQMAAEARMRPVVAQAVGEIPDWENVKGEIGQVINDEPWLIGDGSPEAVARGLKAAAKMVSQARGVAEAHAQVQATQQGIAKRQAAAVETGTAGRAPAAEEADPGQEIANAILEQDRKRREVLGY